MNPQDTELYELFLDQYRQLRETRLHLEALKAMMFEHRPAFVPSFEQKLAQVSDSPALAHLSASIRKIEDRLAQIL